MKRIQTENSLIFIRTATFWRRVGVLFFILSVSAFAFAYYGAIYFGAGDLSSTITYAVISVIVGLTFLFLAILLLSLPDRKLELDGVAGRITLIEKLVRTACREFSFSEVEKVEIRQHDTENSSYYFVQLVLRGGEIIEVPSDNLGDEKKQIALLEQIRQFLAK